MTKILINVADSTRMAAFVLSMIMLATTISACNQADGAESPPEPEVKAARLVRVETIIVTPQLFQEKVQVTGVVDALNDVTISAEAGGRVIEIVELGASVNAGAILARFDERLLKSQLEAAEAAYGLAEDTFRRQKALYEDSVISVLEFENIRTRRDQAESALEQARKMFADTQLASPIRGRVEERFVERGELVAPGSPVVRVVDTRRVKIRAGVPERYAADIVEGAPVSVSLPSVGLADEATLSFVSRVVDAKSRTFPVELEIENSSARLKPEMVVNVSIERRSFAEALVVPQTALVRDDLGTSLYVIVQDGDQQIAMRRTVEPGATFDGMAVVVSGIEAGDQVVVVGQSNLTDGNAVDIVGPTGA